ncbi:hypothetical protein B4135_1206 [Caldibacillus debilis]|uniref:Uncharacterized protein n=1 Tax=Caldibacillus debilis TaxID=301148 RepID=A0A150ME39_9BACI|nr:hypothetical protein B4135_1206 [Caldibacillus debilis]
MVSAGKRGLSSRPAAWAKTKNEGGPKRGHPHAGKLYAKMGNYEFFCFFVSDC